MLLIGFILIGYTTVTSVKFGSRKIQIAICVLKAIGQKSRNKKSDRKLIPATFAVFCLFVFT